MKGFTPNQDGKCVKCLGDCNGGDCNPKDIRECDSCGAGFELKDGKCVACPFGTKQCVDGSASSCFFSFQLVEQADGSFKCERECIGHCAECDGTTCTKCDDDYKFENNRCVPKLECNPSCSNCIPGSRMKPNSTECALCPARCDKCDENDCLSCE